jgi:hypothetical protein
MGLYPEQRRGIVAVADCVFCLLMKSRTSMRSALQWSAMLSLVLPLYPVLVIVALYGTWILAWIAIGHVPQASLDQPDNIAAIRLPYRLTDLLLSGVIPVFVINALLLGARLLYDLLMLGKPSRSGLRILAIAIAIWTFSILILLGAPFNVLYWFWD